MKGRERQRDDDAFCKFLECVRWYEDKDNFRRVLHYFIPYEEELNRLYSRVNDADAYNLDRLRRIDGPEYVFESWDGLGHSPIYSFLA
ncbi:hypothetical protein BG005_007672 [Podila minutissima]|nr:hypothetical protein BG005_007672 [Podila minutissima]